MGEITLDEKGQATLDAIFSTFLFSLVFFILSIIFFAIGPSFINVIANLTLGSSNIQQPGIIVFIYELIPLIFAAIGILLLVKTALDIRQRSQPPIGGVY